MLSIIDSSYHVFRDLKDLSNNLTHKKRKPEQQRDNAVYNERVSITIPYIGVSLINSNSKVLNEKFCLSCHLSPIFLLFPCSLTIATSPVGIAFYLHERRDCQPSSEY